MNRASLGRRSSVLLASFALAACGGTPVYPRYHTETATADPAAGSTPAARADSALPLPRKCSHSGGRFCTPPKPFVDALCQDIYQAVALHLFSTHSPWSRAYVRGQIRAWNSSGGASSADDTLYPGEEVILLVEPQDKYAGMEVSGATGGFDALRWDGSCVTLVPEELSFTRPARTRAAHVAWRSIDTSTREALLTNTRITEASRMRRRECRGIMTGVVTKSCIDADQRLSELIVEHVRDGGKLGIPSKHPW